MGNSASSTVKVFNKNVSESISSTMMNIVERNQARMSGTQEVEIKNLQCANITIGDINQTMVSKFDFSRLSSVVSASEVSGMMKNAVEQAAASDAATDVEFGAIATSSNTNTDMRNENINRVISSYSLSQFKEDMQEMEMQQSVRILDLGGERCENINIGNISQDIYMEMVIQQIAETATEAFATIVAENAANQTGSATAFTKATGPIGDLGRAAANILEGAGSMIGAVFSAPIMMMIGLVMVVVVIAFVIRTMGKLGKGDDSADTGMPMMGGPPPMPMMGGPPAPPSMDMGVEPVAPDFQPEELSVSEEPAYFTPPAQTPAPDVADDDF